MSGKPAARLGDATLKGGPIMQGSRTVLIGSQGGVACSMCPGGVTVGSPVNPIVGAKVLSDEKDFALPGPMNLVWSRTYSSYISKDNVQTVFGDNGDAQEYNAARVGLLGPGWHLPTAMSIVLRHDAEPSAPIDDGKPTRLFDGKGRVTSFDEVLQSGSLLGSVSESLSLYRPHEETSASLSRTRKSPSAAIATAPSLEQLITEGHDASDAAAIHRHLQWACRFNAGWTRDSSVIFAWSWGDSTVWVFKRQTSSFEPSLTSSLQRYQLIAQIDAFGHAQQWHYDRFGILEGFTDGAHRRYRLDLIDVLNEAGFVVYDPSSQASIASAQNAEVIARRAVLEPRLTPWGYDSGLRIAAVQLIADPHRGYVAGSSRPHTLVRYVYGKTLTNHGDLSEVMHGGELRRQFATYGGFMLAHRYAGGSETRYEYETSPPKPSAKVIRQTNVDGLEYRFHYGHNGQGQPDSHCTTVTDSLGRTETYRFAGAGGLQRLIEHTHADGNRTRYEHDTYGRLIATTDALNRKTSYRLDATGALLGVQSAAGITQAERDATSGKIMAATGIDGSRSEYGYDGHERLVEIVQFASSDAPSVTKFHYEDDDSTHSSANPARITDPSGKDKLLQWNPLGQLLAYTDCSSQSTRYRYHRDGQLIEVIDAEDRTTHYDYDPQDRRIATHNADGTNETYRYDPYGRLIETIDIAEKATSYQYDRKGRLIGVTRASLSVGYDWDTADRLSTLINENHATTTFQYDRLDRLIEEVGFDGRTQQYAYDKAGRLIAAREQQSAGVSPASNELTIQYGYDEADRLIARTLSPTVHAAQAQDTLTYDRAGRLTEIVRKRNEIPESTLRFAYDAQGRLTLETQQLGGDGAGYGYAHTLAHRYDVLGNRVGSTLPGIGELELQTYGSGHVHSVSLAGQTILDFERDKLHREHTRTYGKLTLSRALDPMGRLLTQRIQTRDQIEVGQDQIAYLGAAYRYDRAGQLTEVLRASQIKLSPLEVREGGVGGGGVLGHYATLIREPQRTHYSYDHAQRLVGWTNSNEQQASWRFDLAGNRLPQVAAPANAAAPGIDEWQSKVSRNLNNPNFNFIEGNALTRNTANPSIGQWTTNRIDFDGTHHYTYDAYGNLIEKTNDQKGALDRFGYDGEHRLVKAEHLDKEGMLTTSTQYYYDALGRRLEKRVTQHAIKATNAANEANSSLPTEITHYGWDGDRLVTTQTSQEFVHTVYEPNSFVPLLRIATLQSAEHNETEQSKQRALGVLNAFGVNLQDDESETGSPNALATMKALHWNTMNESFAQVAEQGLPEAAKEAMLRMGMNPDAVASTVKQAIGLQNDAHREQLSIHLYHCNHLGTPVALVNEQGKIDWAIELDPWGHTLNEYNPHAIDQPIRMQGQQLDRETNLFYNRHRYYDPSLGRYVTQDPIGLNGGVNGYGYPKDPLKAVDPLGLKECVCTNISMKRKDVRYWGAMTKAPGDNYGHWWTELGPSESYGWWPSKGVGMVDTFKGVPGDLNGQGSFGGTPTMDPHHGDSADSQFNPKIDQSFVGKVKELFGYGSGKSCVEQCEEAAACFRKFAKDYSGEWSWRLGAGRNCHSFQEEGMKQCNLKK